MRAVRFAEYGDADVLKLEQVADPVPGPGEVRVRVEYCALNHLDVWNRRGESGVRIPLPHVLGADVSGTVDAAGPGAGDLAAGTPVLLHPGLSCGHCPECLAGRDNLCRHYTVLGTIHDGGYAEYVVVPRQNVVPRPQNLNGPAAAAFPLVFLTAWHMLVGQARVQPGEHVLVLGGASGVGHAAIQIAKLFGARVTATAGSDEKLAFCRELGADDAFRHDQADILSEVRARTDRRGVDVVVEHVGQVTWDQSVKSLARGGRLVTCGATTGYAALTDLRYLFSRNLSILGSYMGGKAEMLAALDFVAAGRLVPRVDLVFPLAEAAFAHRHLEARRHMGKVVLAVTGQP